jgi:hypothetical protein
VGKIKRRAHHYDGFWADVGVNQSRDVWVAVGISLQGLIHRFEAYHFTFSAHLSGRSHILGAPNLIEIGPFWV